MTDETNHLDVEELDKWYKWAEQGRKNEAVEQAEKVVDDLADIFYKLSTLLETDASVENLKTVTFQAWADIATALTVFPKTHRD